MNRLALLMAVAVAGTGCVLLTAVAQDAVPAAPAPAAVSSDQAPAAPAPAAAVNEAAPAAAPAATASVAAPVAPRPGPAAMMMSKMDADKDGKITYEEFKSFNEQRIKADFQRFDADGDGSLTEDEIQKSFMGGHKGMADHPRHLPTPSAPKEQDKPSPASEPQQ